VIDYQNLHMTAADLFSPGKPKHESLLDPTRYANQLIQRRNQIQLDPTLMATLTKVIVYRGLPSQKHDPKPYARNLAQKAQWERDPRVSVTLRPMKYNFDWGSDGRKVADSRGIPIPIGKEEKGVDVLCALAVVREARMPDVDLVILASQDTDLEPALDEAIALEGARIETVCWHLPLSYWSKEIRPRSIRIWNTRMQEEDFRASLDLNDYR
jgi:hypothetical protein